MSHNPPNDDTFTYNPEFDSQIDAQPDPQPDFQVESRIEPQANYQPQDESIQDPIGIFNPNQAPSLFTLPSPPPVQTANITVYENVRVSYPESKDGKIKNVMVYIVRYSHKGKEFEVRRRYSDFTALRVALRKYAPCHYIYPAHRKKAMVS